MKCFQLDLNECDSKWVFLVLLSSVAILIESEKTKQMSFKIAAAVTKMYL